MESWNADIFAAAGHELNFVQDKHRCSQKGALRWVGPSFVNGHYPDYPDSH
jgi:dTDP-4-dehydrorhamnose 3,5-epimerase-like enzyme